MTDIQTNNYEIVDNGDGTFSIIHTSSGKEWIYDQSDGSLTSESVHSPIEPNVDAISPFRRPKSNYIEHEEKRWDSVPNPSSSGSAYTGAYGGGEYLYAATGTTSGSFAKIQLSWNPRGSETYGWDMDRYFKFQTQFDDVGIKAQFIGAGLSINGNSPDLTERHVGFLLSTDHSSSTEIHASLGDGTNHYTAPTGIDTSADGRNHKVVFSNLNVDTGYEFFVDGTKQATISQNVGIPLNTTHITNYVKNATSTNGSTGTGLISFVAEGQIL